MARNEFCHPNCIASDSLGIVKGFGHRLHHIAQLANAMSSHNCCEMSLTSQSFVASTTHGRSFGPLSGTNQIED